MSIAKTKQTPVILASGDKRDVRTQFGAICWRRAKGKAKAKGDVQVLMITSRRTGRWVVPKGWPQDGATPAEAAATEAWEEAGARGKIKPICLGIYSYIKDMGDDDALPCVVALFPFEVKDLAKDWPEKADRKRKWVSTKKAASMVAEPELAAMLAGFDADAL